MTTTTDAAGTLPEIRKAGFGRLMFSEWAKIRSMDQNPFGAVDRLVPAPAEHPRSRLHRAVHRPDRRAVGRDRRRGAVMADPTSTILGGGLSLATLGLFALALGAIIRHTAAGITGVIGFVLVLAPLAALLPGSIGKHVHAYLPSEAGHLIGQARQAPNDLLTPWQGFGVFAIWTAVLLVIAAVQLKRRDA
jgi:hypothetical protein